MIKMDLTFHEVWANQEIGASEIVAAAMILQKKN